jgi:hypothetical protein
MKNLSGFFLFALIASAGPGLAADTAQQGALAGNHRAAINNSRDPAATLTLVEPAAN